MNAWTNDVAQSIAQTGRGAEFANALAILSKPLILNFEPCQMGKQYDLVLTLEPSEVRRQGAGALYSGGAIVVNPKEIEDPRDNSPVIYLSRTSLNPNSRIMKHELGHTLGIADQYNMESPQFNSDISYGTIAPRPSIMYHQKHLTCDDWDAMITILDRYTKQSI